MISRPLGFNCEDIHRVVIEVVKVRDEYTIRCKPGNKFAIICTYVLVGIISFLSQFAHDVPAKIHNIGNNENEYYSHYLGSSRPYTHGETITFKAKRTKSIRLIASTLLPPRSDNT